MSYFCQLYDLCMILCLAIFASCSHIPEDDKEQAQAHLIRKSTHNAHLRSLDLMDLPLDVPLDTVEITVKYDHVLKREMRYRAILFKPILNYMIRQNEMDTTHTDVIFICKDGYAPVNSVVDIFEHESGYLAFKDLAQEEPQDWPADIAATYAPFYLVWDSIPYGDHRMAWPYGLTSIQLVDTDSLKQKLFPVYHPQLAVGYELYQHNCGKCHSINKVGGQFGPEFNLPRNITEYWDRKDIIAYAKDPSSFRYNGKMPAIKHLKDEEFEHILDYLEYISKYKIE